jgi:VWFA-related protein
MRRVLVLMACFIVPLGFAQNENARKVLIPLSVKDSHRQVISGITPAAFILSERKVPVSDVSLLRGSDLPLELGVIIDTSRSEASSDNLREIFEAARGFVKEIVRTPEDQVFFVVFNNEAEVSPWLKKEQLVGFSLRLTIEGGTALYDAVGVASKDRMGARDWSRPTRRFFVVISDGNDNASRITREEAMSQALKSGVVMFTLNTSSGTSTRGEYVLQNWAKMTGGEYFSGISGKHAARAFATIGETMDGIYYATYVPPDSGDNIHEIEIKPAQREKLQLSYPKKYLWPQ